MYKRVLYYGLAALVFLGGMRLMTWAHSAAPRPNAVQAPVPAYHPAPPRERLAPTLPPADFKDPVNRHAYAAAARIETILYQLPCYCHCDKEVGHTSLLSCYQDRHAAVCAVCKMEAYYAYQMSRRGETARQIRAGIIRGEWQRVNLSSWQKPQPGKSQGR